MRSVFLVVAATCCAQTAHTQLDRGIALEIEYLVHSVPAEGGTLVANDYLVMDAALAGPKEVLHLSSGQFTVRINGKTIVGTQTAGMVANSLLRPEYSNHPVLDAAAGPMVISTRPSAGRFPGDTSTPPPHVPHTSDPEAKDTLPPVEERIQHAALLEGDVTLPVRGLLFFPYRGKTKAIKSLELIYDGPAGKRTLKLF